MIISAGSTSQSVDVLIADDNGADVLGLEAGTFPLTRYKRAGAYAPVSITLVDLEMIDSPYVSGGVCEISSGRYRLDLPNVMLAVPAIVTVFAETTDKRLLLPPIDVTSGGIGGGPAAGAGADEVTIDWTNSTTSLPVAEADVWITSDALGANVIAGTLQTNSQGEATFMLDAGVTYYLFGQKDGVVPLQGTSFVAVAD